VNAYRQLLVHFDPSAQAVARLRAARAIAKEQGAAVAACYAVATSYLDAAYGSEMVPGALDALAAWDRERAAGARQAFDREAVESGPVATWSEAAGIGAAGEFARQALYADLLVLGQDDPSAPFGTPRDFSESVILASGKPALVLPHAGWNDPIGHTAVIAWKPTPEAARAIAAALPLLRRARAVHILQWAGEPDPPITGHNLDLQGYLRLHEIEAQWHQGGEEPDEIGEVVLSRAFDLAADLLVMGCYGHSRARELVLGGMSRTILRAMSLPVLMAH
jgi:nucleotide-binding universal stress UspA family protein